MSYYEDSEEEYLSDNDQEYNEIIYEPEESSLTRYNILLCELYNTRVHGDVTSDVLYHYIVNTRYKELNMYLIMQDAHFINNEYIYMYNQNHDIYRNYRNMILDNYIKPEIGECIYLRSGHCVAILKTYWIRLIQRAWKNILKKRKNIFQKRCYPTSLSYREITGRWPESCLKYPTLKGMISNLQNKKIKI